MNNSVVENKVDLIINCSAAHMELIVNAKQRPHGLKCVADTTQPKIHSAST